MCPTRIYLRRSGGAGQIGQRQRAHWLAQNRHARHHGAPRPRAIHDQGPEAFMSTVPEIPPEEFATMLRVLQTIVEDRAVLAACAPEDRNRLLQLAGQVAMPDPAAKYRLREQLRRHKLNQQRDADEALRAGTGIRALRARPVFLTPPMPALLTASEVPAADENAREHADDGAAQEQAESLRKPRICYTCKGEYTRIHPFYDQLCPPCGDLNASKRAPVHDLRGRIAIVTGARVKIGYHAAILLLRNGCRVVVTTRFPRDCAARYAREPDFDNWRERLSIYGLDLRHTPSVEAFARHLGETLPHLDFLIQNACQTVRRPPAFYAHMIAGEEAALQQLPPAEAALVADYETLRHGSGNAGLAAPAQLSQLEAPGQDTLADPGSALVELFPRGVLDADLQQVDLRDRNSWRLSLDEVPTRELLEVLLVNAVGPFVLSARLKSLMLRTPGRDKHIVQVSAMEGQFNRNKTAKHPHTNMAKAALNMLTRTSAQEYVRDGIHMNSVDTGWITDEDPAHLAEQKVAMHRFSPPLDVVDGAARIVDPIFSGLASGEHAWGQFFKDYKPTYW
jgi:NAD(P)-dependent dehydrogenase (short-subunit alcohol dehydrogenase family)